MQRPWILEKALTTEHCHVKSHPRQELVTIRKPNPMLTLERQFPNCLKQSGTELNRKVCRAKAIGISTEKGWYYLGFHNFTIKLVGNIGDQYFLRLELDDSWGTAFFVSMDTEVQKMVEGLEAVQDAFESIIGVFQDYLITATLYNMKYLETLSFTVAKLPSPLPAMTPTTSARDTEIIGPEDEPVAGNEAPRKKPCLQKIPKSVSASTNDED
ncbi:hypothetical protein C5167_027446 [Papaver somniferum]|nr:hypothetical protein C5167_027446 [Papaver somniferum]